MSAQRHAVVEENRLLNLLGKYLIKIDDGVIRPYLKPLNIPHDMDVSIFSYFHFPVMDFTKSDMQKEAERCNFIDILILSWFCHHPINGIPCGTCNPCIIAVKEGFSNRLPPEALNRYKHIEFYRLYYKVINRLKMIIHKCP